MAYPTFPGDAHLKAAKPWLRSLSYIRFANLMVSRATLEHWCGEHFKFKKSGSYHSPSHPKPTKTPKKEPLTPRGGGSFLAFFKCLDELSTICGIGLYGRFYSSNCLQRAIWGGFAILGGGTNGMPLVYGKPPFEYWTLAHSELPGTAQCKWHIYAICILYFMLYIYSYIL